MAWIPLVMHCWLLTAPCLFSKLIEATTILTQGDSTPRHRVKNFAYLRSAVLAKDLGYKYFAIIAYSEYLAAKKKTLDIKSVSWKSSGHVFNHGTRKTIAVYKQKPNISSVRTDEADRVIESMLPRYTKH